MSVEHTRNIYKNALNDAVRKTAVAKEIQDIVALINKYAALGHDYVVYDLRTSVLLDYDFIKLEKLGYTWEYLTDEVVKIEGWADV